MIILILFPKDFNITGNIMYHMVENTTNMQLRIISLFISDYLAGFHVREMGKLLKKSHVTLLPHLKILEKDKILTSKLIGKIGYTRQTSTI